VSFSLIETTVGWITLFLGVVGLPGIFAMMTVESFGIPPLPSEVILPFSGFLVAEGAFSLGAAFAVALAGGLAGSFIAYAIGRWWRHRMVDKGVGALRLRSEDLDRVDRWFAQHGDATVGLCRLLPVIRSYISYPAGTARMNPTKFGLLTVVGSIPWTFGLLYAGYLLGSNWQVVLRYVQPLDYLFGAALVILVLYLVLVATGHVAPGWPPRRATPAATTSTPPSSPAGPRP
jgi:membrane protein DedA with SNARE-associated domain